MKRPQLKILGIIGDPVHHSLSPLMHNAACAHLQLSYLYMPFSVKPEELEGFFHSLALRKISGLNVTIPHKQAVIQYMDSLSFEARLAGAVNTILVKGAKLTGYNTDCVGYLASLEKEAGFKVQKKQVILLGAGGAARAIATAMGMGRAHEVLIINRTAKKAFDLAHYLNKKFPNTIYSAGSFDDLNSYFWPTTDLLVNATSMGLAGKKAAKLPLGRLPGHALVSDIVYTPPETSLLRQAKRLKLKTLPGYWMLLYQGALSFEMWTGKKAPVEVMKNALFEAMKL